MPITLHVYSKEGFKELPYEGSSIVDVGEEIQVSGMTLVIKYVDTDGDGNVVRIEANEKEYNERQRRLPFLL